MFCPVCNNKETSVIDSRPNNDGMIIRRRRECNKCSYRFSTIEEIELLDLIVIKSDGHRETYMRGKLENSLRIPLTKRSFTEEDFSKLIHSIERDIQKKKKRELTSKELGELVMKHLRTFDKVAYIRFASVYRDFKDVKNFEKEVKKISEKK
ncbi:MAG: transcriptional regulator NrdR [Candidatus Magasanikbacteria bacterium]|nr:transcriptional regulator NrdR [Candidatus Magasanikbacteria bacterium]